MKKLETVLAACAWGYLAATLAALALMHLAGDRWWPGTLLLFGPRWVLALPLVPLVPLLLWRKPALLAPAALAGIIVAIPFMGLEWSLSAPEASGSASLRVLTCNVQTGSFDPKALSRLIVESRVDVVALQECPKSVSLHLPGHWSRAQAGMLAIFSRYLITPHAPVLTRHAGHAWPRHSLLACDLETPAGVIVFAAIHLPSPRYGLAHLLDRKTGIDPAKADLLAAEIKKRSDASALIRTTLAAHGRPVIAAGDFNMPKESRIYARDWSGMWNAFSERGRGYGWSFRDRAGPIPINVRIDHILCSEELTPLSIKVGQDLGSDHLPLIAEILLPTPH